MRLQPSQAVVPAHAFLDERRDQLDVTNARVAHPLHLIRTDPDPLSDLFAARFAAEEFSHFTIDRGDLVLTGTLAADHAGPAIRIADVQGHGGEAPRCGKGV